MLAVSDKVYTDDPYQNNYQYACGWSDIVHLFLSMIKRKYLNNFQRLIRAQIENTGWAERADIHFFFFFLFWGFLFLYYFCKNN